MPTHGAAMSVPRGQCIAVGSYTREINNLTFHLKKLELEKQIKSPSSRRKEILKVMAEIKK